MPGMGVDSFLRVVYETNYGAGEAGLWTIPITSESLALDFEEFESQTIAAGVARDAALGSFRKVAGAVNFQATYNLMDHFLWGILGKYVQSTPTGATNARDKWFEQDTDEPSFHFEANRGDIEADDEVFSYDGCKLTALEITIPDRGIVTLATEVIGKTESSDTLGRTAFGTVSGDPKTPQYVLTSGLQSPGAIVFAPAPDAGSYCIRGVTIRVERPLSQSWCVGAITPNEPFLEDFLSVSGEYLIEFKDCNVYYAFVAGTYYTTNALKFVGGTCEGSLKYEFEVRLTNLRWLSPSVPFIDRRGKLIARCPFRCIGNAGTGAAGIPDEVSTKQPIAFRTRNLNLGADL